MEDLGTISDVERVSEPVYSHDVPALEASDASGYVIAVNVEMSDGLKRDYINMGQYNANIRRVWIGMLNEAVRTDEPEVAAICLRTLAAFDDDEGI